MGRVLLRGGRIHSPLPGASALLIDGDEIAWVGSDAAAAGLGEPDAVIELDGAWVAPAFVDAHVHAVAAGRALRTVDLTGARDRNAVLERVEVAARSVPAGGIVWGTGWDETGWADEAVPTATELDRAASGRPVYLTRVDLHSALASSVLLQEAGVPDTGEPVRGQAHHAVRGAAHAHVSDEHRRLDADAFFALAARQGIGSVHECAGPEIGGEGEVAIVRAAAQEAGIDLVTYWGEAGPEGIERAQRLGAQPGGDIFIDGSLGSHTAALSSPYADAAGSGSLLIEPAAVAEHLIAATQAGLQAGFHAIGDAAISAFVAGLELAAETVGVAALAGARHRVEHLELADQRHRLVLARFGVVACMQPSSDACWGGEGGMYAGRLGSGRAGAMNDFAALAAAGVPLAFGSDAPVAASDPWATIRAAVTPHTASHALSARAAFAAHTRGGHRAARRDDSGVLREGAQASFTVWANTGPLVVTVPDDRMSAWSTDPRAGAPGLPALEGFAPECVATLVRGTPVYDRADLLAALPQTDLTLNRK